MRFHLTPADRDGLHELWRRLRHASHQTNLASAKWNRISDELNDLAARSGWNDDVTAANRNASRALADALGAWSFWEREVSRLAATLQAEYAVRAMFGLVEEPADPTGLRYERDEDEPPAPSTRPHSGWSVPGRAARTSDSPAGPPRPSPGRPGPQPSGARVRLAPGTEQGGTVAGSAAVPPALRGAGSIW
jgi:hypothetical protein